MTLGVVGAPRWAGLHTGFWCRWHLGWEALEGLRGDNQGSGEASGLRTEVLGAGHTAGACPFWGHQELCAKACLPPQRGQWAGGSLGFVWAWEAIPTGEGSSDTCSGFPVQLKDSGWPPA